MAKLGLKQILTAAYALLATALLGVPLLVEAQQVEKTYRVGYLSIRPLPDPHLEAFRQGLQDLGYVEGRNVVLVTRSAEGVRDRVSRLASEIIAEQVDVVAATTGVSALALKGVTSRIPVVMTSSSDAVAMGIVDSLARPGGNITGFTIINPELAPKRLELLAALPGVTTIAVLWCPVTPINHEELRRTSAAATSLGVKIVPVEYQEGSTTWESELARVRPSGLFMLDCTTLPVVRLEEFAVEHRLPLMSPYIVRASQRALLAYGADTLRMARRAAVVVDKILKGAKPADLPVEQPTEFEFVVNLKIARAIGLKVPQSILTRASRLVE